jgi:phage gpG-like protein
MANLTISVSKFNLPPDFEAKLTNPKPLFQQWASYLDSITVTAFKSESSPAGVPWAALSPAYAKRKAADKKARYGLKKLKYTGVLFDSLAATILPDGVRVGTNVSVGKYSLGAIHQYGAPKRNIPARPFLPLDPGGEILPQTKDRLNAIAAKYFR